MAKTLEIRTKTDVDDFVRGCTFYGTGGGGSPKYGAEILSKVLKEGKKVRAVAVNSIPDDAWTVCAYGMGSIALRTPEVQKEMASLGLERVRVAYKLADAIRELEELTSTKIDAIVPLEIGGANTPDPVATAAHMGISVVDGDYSGGRAIPEIIQTGPHISGIRMNPLASVDEWGNRVLIKDSVNNLVAEKLGKLVSILAYGNLAGNATYLVRGKEMKRLVTPGTVSKSFKAGRVIREAREKGKKIDEEITKTLGGFILFQGDLVKKEDQDHDGYYWGTNTVRGKGKFSNHTFAYWFKNENHVTWLDGKLHATSPDIICVIDSERGEPITNPASKVGDSVSIIAFSSNKSFRTKKALEVLGPRHFGFDADYTPLERLLR